ncbi:ClpXP protease specificity-enhancing factor [Roseateles koreensis]|uniref:ClpXP protease specificity-enhancing factor n=1 Tax=Roseateles koreensis TaxID=2987526 RepID=A0ABT5KTV2_9BURK|nr:ClpXP protease specificity-enhancing factor [Roseateles koreensis]MDC8785870.1 ClpXP protease specificity-enhancing factor [Roseateles koreensis]
MDQNKDKDGTVATSGTSTRPYLIRALHGWCTDNGFTPYIAVHVDRFVQVPMEYVSNNEIVLNVGFEATSSLDLGNDVVQFKARFGGIAREIIVPVDHVVAIYARENGQGMAFPPPEVSDVLSPETQSRTGLSSSGAETDVEVDAVPAKPARGLRLATSPGGPPPEAMPESGKSEGLAPTLAPDTNALTAGPDDEPEGPGPSGGRPALKRVK